MEELRSEMLEMRDMYMEDDVYQLQELRQQLEQVRLLADTPIAIQAMRCEPGLKMVPSEI